LLRLSASIIPGSAPANRPCTIPTPSFLPGSTRGRAVFLNWPQTPPYALVNVSEDPPAPPSISPFLNFDCLPGRGIFSLVIDPFEVICFPLLTIFHQRHDAPPYNDQESRLHNPVRAFPRTPLPWRPQHKFFIRKKRDSLSINRFSLSSPRCPVASAKPPFSRCAPKFVSPRNPLFLLQLDLAHFLRLKVFPVPLLLQVL